MIVLFKVYRYILLITYMSVLCGCGSSKISEKSFPQVYKKYKKVITNGGKHINLKKSEDIMNDLLEVSLLSNKETRLKCDILECHLAAFANDTSRADYLVDRILASTNDIEIIAFTRYLHAIAHCNPYHWRSINSGLPEDLEFAIELWRRLLDYPKYKILAQDAIKLLYNVHKNSMISVIQETFKAKNYVACLYQINNFLKEYNDTEIIKIKKQCLKSISS